MENNIDVVFFDLFFTLITPQYNYVRNENDVLGITKEEWKKLCLISNADVIDVMNWKESPLNDLFDDTIFSYEVGYLKPQNEIYEIALKKMNTISQKCIFVGDGGSNEIKGAKELGMKTIQTGYLLKKETKEYNALRDIMLYRQKELMEERKAQNERIKNGHMVPFEYDDIDDDIYKCFITGKGSYIEVEVGTMSDFRKVEEKLDTICKEHVGKYHKSEAKSAKFAILFSYSNRTASIVNSFREKGYKVTSFENMIEHFGLTEIWDTRGLKERVRKQKEYYRSL